METAPQRDERIARLEEGRAKRRADGVVWPTPDSSGTGVVPVELGPGRGDLNYSSTGLLAAYPTALSLVGQRTVSFSRLFMSQPWVAAAVMRMLTWAIRVPLKCYRRVGDDPEDKVRLRYGDHPLATAIERPWDRGSQAELIQAMLGNVLVHGNSVIEVDVTGDKIGFAWKDWRFARPLMPWRDSIEGFKFDVDTPSLTREVSIDQVLHVHWWSPIGPIGVSPLQQLGVTLRTEDAAQRFQHSNFQNGARPSAAITASEEFLGLDPVERQQIMVNLRADLTDLYAGPENAGKPALLPPGLTWVPVGQTTVEAELINQRKIAREEIAAVYLIPPPLLGILDRATYSNIQTQRDMTYTDCLGPPLVLCEQSLNAQIGRDLLQEPEVFVEFDFGAVLRGDRLQEMEALRAGIGNAMLTPNEGRGVLNLAKSDQPGMDKFYLPTNNLAPVGTPPSSPTPIPVSFGGPTPDPAGSPPGRDGPAVTPNDAKRLFVRSRDADYVLTSTE